MHRAVAFMTVFCTCALHMGVPARAAQHAGHRGSGLLMVIPSTPTGGNPFLVRFTADTPSTFTVTFAARCFPLFARNIETAPVYETYLASSVPARGGFTLAVRDERTGTTVARLRIRIRPRVPVVTHMSEVYTKTRKRRPANSEQNRMLMKALRTSSSERLWTVPFIPPLDSVIVSSFGVQRIVAGGSSYYHNGVDLRGGVGTPVRAPNDGVVVLVGRNFNAHGNCLVLDHGQGITSCYLHLYQIHVREGDHVSRGDTIATVGNTGWSTGAHLHYGVYVQGTATDPIAWSRLTGETADGE